MLFNVIADSLKQKLLTLLIKYRVDLSQFADESAVWKGTYYNRTNHTTCNRRKGQRMGVLISTGKTQVVLFNAFGINPTKLKKLILDGKELKYTNVATFLGMNFDSYLTWKDRFDTLRSVDATRT